MSFISNLFTRTPRIDKVEFDALKNEFDTLVNEIEDASGRYDANGFINMLSGVGGSKDFGSNTEVKPKVDLTFEQFAYLYANNALARKIVDYVPKTALRNGFEIRVNGEEENEIEKELKELKFKFKLRKCFSWARCDGGCALIIGIKDGKESDKEVDWNKVTGIDYIHIATRLDLNPGWRQHDVEKAFWNEPKTYFFQGSGGRQLHVHRERMIIIKGNSLPPILEEMNDGWGDSVLRGIAEPLGRIETAMSAISHIIQRWNQVVWKMKNLKQYVDKDQQKVVQKKVDLMQETLSILGVILLDKDTEEWSQEQMNVSGLDKLVEKLQSMLSAACSIPEVILFGRAPAGMGSDDKSSERNFENVILDEQEEHLTPAYEQMCKIVGSYTNKGSEFTVKAKPIHAETSLEKELRLKEKATAIKLLAETQVVDPAEFRTSYFQNGNEFGIILDKTIDLNDVGTSEEE